MNSNKILIGGIIGGIAFFLLGWVIYGMLLMDFMKENGGMTADIMRPQTDMIWWALILGNLFSGVLLSYVLGKAGASSAAKGASVGFIFGLLIGASFDLIWYATSTIYSVTTMLVDIAVGAVMTTIVGAVIGWYLGSGKKAA